MSKPPPSPDLLSLLQQIRAAPAQGVDPRDGWDPPFCGDMDMRIAADGTWFYLGSPIGRPELVKLFASVLRRENDGYFLVTPVEKLGLRVDDAPFSAVELRREGEGRTQTLNFRTSVDDWLPVDEAHMLRFETEADTGGLKPYIHVRKGLWARVSRPLFYDLAALGETQTVQGVEMFGVWSGGHFWTMAPFAALEGLGA